MIADRAARDAAPILPGMDAPDGDGCGLDSSETVVSARIGADRVR